MELGSPDLSFVVWTYDVLGVCMIICQFLSVLCIMSKLSQANRSLHSSEVFLIVRVKFHCFDSATVSSAWNEGQVSDGRSRVERAIDPGDARRAFHNKFNCRTRMLKNMSPASMVFGAFG